MAEISNENPADVISQSGSSAWPRSLFLLAVAVFLYVLLVEFPATPFFGDSDQSIFLYEAQRIFNGDVMYRDFFEFTLPGTQIFYAAMFAIFGVKFWIVSVTIIAIGVANAWLLIEISKRILPSPLYFLPATIYVFFGFRWAGLDGSHRMFSPVFILLAIWLVMRGKGRVNLVLAGGSLAAASFFTQQRGLVALAGILIFLVFEKFISGDEWSKFLKAAATISAAFAVCLASLCIYFVVAAGLDNFIYATLTYPVKYYSYGHPNNFSVFLVDLKKAFTITRASDVLALLPVTFYCFMIPLVSLSFIGLIVKKRKNLDWAIWRDPVLIALTGSLLIFSITAPNTPRLFQISGPAIIVFVWLCHRFGPSMKVQKTFAFATVAGLMLLGAGQAFRMQTHWDVFHLESQVGRLALVRSEQADRYLWLSKNTIPGDYFFEVYEPFVYFPLGLKNPTRFGQIWPSEYTRPEHVAEAVRDLGLKRPKYMLWDNGYFSTETPRTPGDNTGPLADFVKENYSPIGDVYNIDERRIQIWEIKPR